MITFYSTFGRDCTRLPKNWLVQAPTPAGVNMAHLKPGIKPGTLGIEF